MSSYPMKLSYTAKLIVFLLCTLASTASVADDTLFPGATVDSEMEAEWKEISEMIGAPAASFDSRYYTSDETFEDVTSYYAKMGTLIKEHSENIPRLPNGMVVMRHIYTLDGAKSVPESHHWVTVQFPRLSMKVVPLLQLKQQLPEGAVRKATSIILTTRKPGEEYVPKHR